MTTFTIKSLHLAYNLFTLFIHTILTAERITEKCEALINRISALLPLETSRSYRLRLL